MKGTKASSILDTITGSTWSVAFPEAEEVKDSQANEKLSDVITIEYPVAE